LQKTTLRAYKYRIYPSVKVYSICSYKIDKLSLSNRVWTYPYCNTTYDRDINASKNILKKE